MATILKLLFSFFRVLKTIIIPNFMFSRNWKIEAHICSTRSRLTAIMALDHSRLGLENKFLENKSGRIFCVRQVYKFLPINLGACKPIFYFFYTPHLRRKSTMRRCFYHTDLVQNAVFHNFSRQIAFIQYSGPSKNAWTFN